MTFTPAFARWSLSRNCDFRDETKDPFDPVAVERELRPLQEASQAIIAGRAVDGLALEPSDWRRLSDRDPMLATEAIRGFSIDEILDYYGGEDSADAVCGGCPANVDEERGDRWAGCFGLATASPEVSCDELDQILEASGAAEALDRAFPATRPRWFGWWIDGEWSREQADAMLAALAAESPAVRSVASALAGSERLRKALIRGRKHGLAVRVASFPPGRISGRAWIVEAHCPRCKAPADAAARFCRVCRRAGGMFPARTRKARGDRPYHPLAKLVSRERLEAVVRTVVERTRFD